MKLAVLRAKDTVNIENLPKNYPVKCKEVPDDYSVEGEEILMTVEELTALKEENKALYEAWGKNWQETVIEPSQWLENRVDEYPSVGDQLDMLWHAMQLGEVGGGETEWFKTIQSVKDKYPKN